MTNPKINLSGTKTWFNEYNQYHRDDGPAVEYANGDRTWYKDGKRHREDGPAVEWYLDSDHSRIEYWYKGNHIEFIKTDKEWKTYLNCKLFW